MPRYEFVEGSSSKFWDIQLDGSSFVTTYGRIGTDGQSSMKEFDSPEKARKEYDKLVAEKTKKGYEPVDGDGADDESDEEEVAAPPPTRTAAAKPAAKPAAKAVAAPPAAPTSDLGAPRYFEFVEGSSSKFWEIRLEGTAVLTRYGRIGSAGQETMKEFDTDAKARKEFDKLVAEKAGKGYVEAAAADADDDSDESAETPPPKPAAKAAPKAAAKPAAKPAVEDDDDEEEADGGGMEGARYFEFVEGSSSKFWEIRLEGTAVMTRYGRIGSAGQETMKEFDSDAKAQKEYDKLVGEKTKKGYEEKS